MRVLGLAIDHADEEEAVLHMDVPETLVTPFGTVHGGAIAVLFDTALAVAIARRLPAPNRIATHNLNVSYVAFARDRLLRCRAWVVSLRTTVALAEGEVRDGAGRLVAKALGTFGVRRPAPES
jgi:uncharacterized protein (TIGR00369 family)